jgi:hypothetical protein
MLPSPSLGPPLLSASWSPPLPCGIGLGGCAAGGLDGGAAAGWLDGAGWLAALCLCGFLACSCGLCGFAAGLVDCAAGWVAVPAGELDGAAAACGCRLGADDGLAVEQPATRMPVKATAASNRASVGDMQRSSPSMRSRGRRRGLMGLAVTLALMGHGQAFSLTTAAG